MVFHLCALTCAFLDDAETWKHKNTAHIYNIFPLRVFCNVPREINIYLINVFKNKLYLNSKLLCTDNDQEMLHHIVCT